MRNLPMVAWSAPLGMFWAQKSAKHSSLKIYISPKLLLAYLSVLSFSSHTLLRGTAAKLPFHSLTHEKVFVCPLYHFCCCWWCWCCLLSLTSAFSTTGPKEKPDSDEVWFYLNKTLTRVHVFSWVYACCWFCVLHVHMLVFNLRLKVIECMHVRV